MTTTLEDLKTALKDKAKNLKDLGDKVVTAQARYLELMSSSEPTLQAILKGMPDSTANQITNSIVVRYNNGKRYEIQQDTSHR